MDFKQAGLDNLWQKVKEKLAQTLPPNSFQIWIQPLVLLKTEGDRIILGCPNSFFLQWVKRHFYHFLKEAWKQYAPEYNDVIFETVKNKKKTSIAVPQPTLPLAYPRLCENFTFKEFIVGRTNQYAYTAAYNLANDHLDQPIFFCSDTGLGKSHLSQSIANHMISSGKYTKILYITAEDFTNEMVSALKEHRIHEFKKKYRRDCNVLILENIHFLSGKEKIQTELNYTLDVLWERRKKVVFTSLIYPQNIPGLKKELRSRIESSLMVPIDPPDFKMRLEILRKKAKRKNVLIPENVLEYLAQHIDGDVRRLESAINNIKARSLLQKRAIDLDLAKEVREMFTPRTSKINLSEIKKLVCQHYKINCEDLISKSRQKQIIIPRKLAIYLAKRYLNLSLTELGKNFRRHHSSILNALNSIEKEIKKREFLSREVKYLCKKIEEKM
ncbi:MAG: Chromosomal replication initiator protein DnaA [Candidatus Methanoperedenaceae archaeon GB50]|nr:MAG: Chromosomal replication initiator protein DnaA [Candidatus Methanoperedenaceae archaeon GB50]